MPTTKRGRSNKDKKTDKSSERLHQRSLREAVSVVEGHRGPERAIQDEHLTRAVVWTAARGSNTEVLRRLLHLSSGASGPNGDELGHDDNDGGAAATSSSRPNGDDSEHPQGDGTTADPDTQKRRTTWDEQSSCASTLPRGRLRLW